MATDHACLIPMPATLLLASVNSVNSNHIGSQCLSVGFGTIKLVKYRS